MRRVPERLTPLDASFLHTETASAHMHVAWKGRFRPDPARPAITLARVRAQVASRLGRDPALPQRLAFPPGGFARRVWVDAEDFDLRRHVVALSARSRCSQARFDARADAVLSRPLDRSHPLWEIHLAPRLEDGTVGLRDEDPPRDGRRQVRAGGRAAAARPRPGGARARARRRSAGRGAGPGAARLAVEALVEPAPSRCARSGAPRGRRARPPGSAGRCGARRWRSARTSRARPRPRSSTPRSARAARSSATRCRSRELLDGQAGARGLAQRRRARRSSPARCASSRCCAAWRRRR